MTTYSLTPEKIAEMLKDFSAYREQPDIATIIDCLERLQKVPIDATARQEFEAAFRTAYENGIKRAAEGAEQPLTAEIVAQLKKTGRDFGWY